MMEQLGIQALRPGPSGNEAAPNHANYDESLANPFPDYPEILRLKNGRPVTTSDVWWHQRRPEIVEDFDREIYGRVPKKIPPVKWTVRNTTEETRYELAVVTKQVLGHVDNSSDPNITVEIQLVLTTPAKATGPVPIIMEFGFTGTPLLKTDKQKSIEVFGRYIHTYKFDEAVKDGVVLDLLYEARDIDQNITSQDKIDQWFEAKTKGLNDLAKAELKRRWGTMKKVLSCQDRLEKIVADVLMDMETRDRLNLVHANRGRDQGRGEWRRAHRKTTPVRYLQTDARRMVQRTS